MYKTEFEETQRKEITNDREKKEVNNGGKEERVGEPGRVAQQRMNGGQR